MATKKRFLARFAPRVEALMPRILLAADFSDQESPPFLPSADNDTPGNQVVTHVGGGGVVDSSSTGARIAGADMDSYDFSPAVPGEVMIMFGNNDGDANADDDLDINVVVVTSTGTAEAITPAPPATIGAGGSALFAISGAGPTDVFRITVTGDTLADDANYTLRILNKDVKESGGGNNTPISATIVSAGVAPDQTITFPDRDFFRFDPSPDLYAVTLIMPPGTGSSATMTNLGLRLYDTSLKLIGSTGASNGTSTESVTFAAAAVPYYIEVYSGSHGQVNEYDLKIGATTGSISGFKFADLNADGLWGPDEAGLAGVTIQLDYNNDDAGPLGSHDAETVTDASGFYQFSGVPLTALPVVHEVSEVVPPGFFRTAPPDAGRAASCR